MLDRRTFTEPLLAWYRREKRDLPWRRSSDPYAIWVSEVMLQQTRVETVKPYWERFLARFPDVRALAAAPEDEVLHAFAGLGYYRRARALHAAAREVVRGHGGKLPDNATGLRELPGFGPYTAAAVASIAFGRDEPLVDGNVARVLARVTARPGEARSPRALRELSELAFSLLPRGVAGDFNQALMELGAMVCGPDPACDACPVASACEARRLGRQREIPPPRAARERPSLHLSALLVRRGEKVLLCKRPERGLFAGMWELPSIEAGEDAPAAAAELARAAGLQPPQPRPLARVEQTLTHRELSLSVFACEAPARYRPRPPRPYVEARIASTGASAPGGIASVTRKALAATRLLP